MDELDRRLADLATIATQMATVNANLGHMDRDISALRDQVEVIGHNMDQRDQQVSKERKETRVALYGMIAVLGASFVTAVGAIAVGVLG